MLDAMGLSEPFRLARRRRGPGARSKDQGPQKLAVRIVR